MQKLTFEQFVQKANAVHSGRYHYPAQEYAGKRGKITFICPTHGARTQGAGNHLSGAACRACGEAVRVQRRSTGRDGFIQRGTAVYKGLDTYESVVYVNTMTPVVVTCATHGTYSIRPHNYLRMGQRCSQCAKEGTAVHNPIKDKYNAHFRHRLATDPLHAMKKRLRKRLRESLVKRHAPKDKTLLAVLGCTYQELLTHIEAQFLPGMGWSNMQLWHVDHVVPLATAKTVEDIYRLNHYTNLQPLWALDNLYKSARLPATKRV